MNNHFGTKQVAVYYRVPPESKFDNTQVVSEIKNIQNLCRQHGWKLSKTFIDKSASGSMYNTMRAFVTDPSNNISATVCYTAGDDLEVLDKNGNTQTYEGRADNTDNKFVGGVPYGYVVSNGGSLVIDTDKAAVVLEIFKAKAEGDSLQRIADALNKSGVKSSRGGDWTKQAIAFVIKNPAYMGHYRINGKTLDIPRIVSTQLYHKANA